MVYLPTHQCWLRQCWRKLLQWLWRRCGDKQVWKFVSLKNGRINRFKCASSRANCFWMPEMSWTYIPNTCSSISPGHWSWSISPLPMCYSHFLLWGGINLTHYAFKLSRRGDFSAKRWYRSWLLHSNSVPEELAEVELSGPRGIKQTNLHFSIVLLERARQTASSHGNSAGSYTFNLLYNPN